ECGYTNGVAAESVFRTCLRFSWPAWRSDQVVVVGWRRVMFVCETAGAWALHLATSRKRNRVADASAAVDAFGGNRLATTATHIHAGGVGIETNPNGLEKLVN